jgi:tetratricopeptide (TPR) repeat protein
MMARIYRSAALAVALTALAGPLSITALADGDYIADMETGRTAFRAGKYSDSEVAFQGAIKGAETDKQRAMAWFAFSLTALRLGHMADAKARAEQSLALVPDNPRAKDVLAIASGGAAAAAQ